MLDPRPRLPFRSLFAACTLLISIPASLAACGGDAENPAAAGNASGASDTGGGGAGPDAPVACEDLGIYAPLGKPCAPDGATCEWSHECEAEHLICEAGAWDRRTGNSGRCPETPPPVGSTCPPANGWCPILSLTCTYTVETQCGQQQAAASCKPDQPLPGWTYESNCQSDCTAHRTAGDCGTDPSCYWIGRCDTGTTQCIRNEGCSSETLCPAGQTCVETTYDPADPTSVACGEATMSISVCVPQGT